MLIKSNRFESIPLLSCTSANEEKNAHTLTHVHGISVQKRHRYEAPAVSGQWGKQFPLIEIYFYAIWLSRIDDDAFVAQHRDVERASHPTHQRGPREGKKKIMSS